MKPRLVVVVGIPRDNPGLPHDPEPKLAAPPAAQPAARPAAPPYAITGLGVACPLGTSVQAAWAAIAANASAIGPLTQIETPQLTTSPGGQLPPPPAPPPEQALEKVAETGNGLKDGEGLKDTDDDRVVAYLRLALREALSQARLRPDQLGGRTVGVVLGTTLHGMPSAGRYLRSHHLQDLLGFQAGRVLAQAIRGLPIHGPTATISSACSSGLGALGHAAALLDADQADIVIAGGYDPISEYTYAGFNALRVMAPDRPRPFGQGRQGMQVSEGFGLLVLERPDDARARHAAILATLAGLGESSDAHHLTQPDPSGQWAAHALSQALAAAGTDPDQVQLLLAHATGTPFNDDAEHAAYRRVFGQRLGRLPVVALKGRMAHTLAAAGSVELALMLHGMRQNLRITGHPEANPAFDDLNLQLGPPKPAEDRCAAAMSLGFGGANTSVVVRAGDAPTPPAEPPPPGRQDLWVTGIGVVLPQLDRGAPIAPHWWHRDGVPPHIAGPVDEAALQPRVRARRARRLSKPARMLIAAADEALEQAGLLGDEAWLNDCPALVGTAHGAANYSLKYYQQIIDEGPGAANPMLFAEGVPNATSAHLGMHLKLHAACQTVIGTVNAGLQALQLAVARLRCGRWHKAIICATEEHCPLVQDAYAHFGLLSPQDAQHAGEGAVAFVLESKATATQRGVRQPLGLIQDAGQWHLPDQQITLPDPGLLHGVDRLIAGSALPQLGQTESKALARFTDRPVLRPAPACLYSLGPMVSLAAHWLNGSQQTTATAPGKPPATATILAADVNRSVAWARVANAPETP